MKTTPRIIDSHQHFWRLSRGDYHWLTPDLSVLYRDYLPSHLESCLKQFEITGTVLVQAAPTLDETRFLLDLAEKHAFILGVVGWVDMVANDAVETLTSFADSPWYRGTRPMIQDIPDVNWILDDKLIPALQTLESHNLVFDALILPNHLSHLLQIAERHPGLKIVINHGAKPCIKDGVFEPWASDIQALATFPNVYCKLSGLLTEAGDKGYDSLIPYMDHLFTAFGDSRILWGSDYPVLNLAGEYGDWFSFCWKYALKRHPETCRQVFGEVAANVYRL